MDKLIKYMKSLNPQKEDQAILIYGSFYKIWRDGEYIGIGQWTQDNNIGDSFQYSPDPNKPNLRGVIVGDRWELVKKKNQEK